MAHIELIATRPIQNSRRPRPHICSTGITLSPFVPSKNIFQLRHELSIAQIRMAFANESRCVDDILRKEIYDLEELIVGLSIIQSTLDTIKELSVVRTLRVMVLRRVSTMMVGGMSAW
jgi:hypothetical protein